MIRTTSQTVRAMLASLMLATAPASAPAQTATQEQVSGQPAPLRPEDMGDVLEMRRNDVVREVDRTLLDVLKRPPVHELLSAYLCVLKSQISNRAELSEWLTLWKEPSGHPGVFRLAAENEEYVIPGPVLDAMKKEAASCTAPATM